MRAFLSLISLSLMLISTSLVANNQVIKAVAITENIHMLMGQGGNVGVFIGRDGTFLIDDQFAPMTEEIISKIKSLGGGVPKFLLNTHYHSDHSGGNENLGEQGTLIFSHDNVRERLRSGSFLREFNIKLKASEGKGLPVVTFSENMSFHINGDVVRAIHTPHAHSDGDSFIHFEKQNVIHAGDLFFNGFFPFIDVDHGGSLKGMINGVNQMLLLTNNSTTIIPGHGQKSNKTELIAYRDMLQLSLNRLKALREQGLSLEEIIAAKPLKDLDNKWGKSMFTADKWIEQIFAGIY